MKTQQYFLILLTFFPWILEAQPLADLSGMKVGDSVLVEVKTETKQEHHQASGELSFLEEESEIFTYALKLIESDGVDFRFKGLSTRVRTSYILKYKGLPFSHRNEKKTVDTDFDLGNPKASSIQAQLNRSFEFVINTREQQHTVLIGIEPLYKKLYFFRSKINPEGLSNHIHALFFVKNHPVKYGKVSAKLLQDEQRQLTRISGKIFNPSGDMLEISNKYMSVNLSPLSKRIPIDPAGNFYGEIYLSKPTYLFLSFKGTPTRIDQNPNFNELIPLFIEPGDDVIIDFDPRNSENYCFLGPNWKKHQAFRTCYEQLLDKYTGIKFFLHESIFYLDQIPFALKKNHKALSSQSPDKAYRGLLALLEKNRQDLGDEPYFKLKSEIIYSYALLRLTNLVSNNAFQVKNVPFIEDGPLELFHLTLNEDKEFYLKQLGLRLADVKSSYAYANFLEMYLFANHGFLEEKKPNSRTRIGTLKNYHMACYTYQGFALQTYLKHTIKTWLNAFNSHSLFENTRGNLDVIYGRKTILSEFKELCNHKPYLEEIARMEEIFSKVEKGKPAPDIKFSETEKLSDYFGQKIAIIFFREIKGADWQLDLDQYATKFPSVKWFFINVATDDRLFNQLSLAQEINDLLYYFPGYGANQDRPYFVNQIQPKFILIDQEARLWGSKTSQTNPEVFDQELQKLVDYQPNYIGRFWDSYQKEIYLIIGSFCAFLVLWGIYWLVFIRNKRRKQLLQNQRIETELRAIRSQMNPHFLFNSLSSVQNLINQSDKEKANHYLSRFSQLVRKVLNHSEQALIPLEEELKVVDLYCELEALRFKFDYQIEVDSDIDAQTMEIPSMLIQPYVENSVRHGLATQGSTGFIGVYVRKQLDCILIEIEDNGIGIRRHQEEFAGHVKKSGFGLRLSDERVKKINERYKMKIEVKIFDRRDEVEPSHGTRVLVRIPLED